MIKNSFLLLVLTISIYSCSSVKDGLSMKKKDNVNEFLIKKKSPLVLPPQYSKLPITIESEDNEIKEDKKIDISKVLKKKSGKNVLSDNSKNLEKSISNILNKK